MKLLLKRTIISNSISLKVGQTLRISEREKRKTHKESEKEKDGKGIGRKKTVIKVKNRKFLALK